MQGSAVLESCGSFRERKPRLSIVMFSDEPSSSIEHWICNYGECFDRLERAANGATGVFSLQRVLLMELDAIIHSSHSRVVLVSEMQSRSSLWMTWNAFSSEREEKIINPNLSYNIRTFGTGLNAFILLRRIHEPVASQSDLCLGTIHRIIAIAIITSYSTGTVSSHHRDLINLFRNP
jgi:hypothetical protein